MKKSKLIGSITFMVSVTMISIGMVIQSENDHMKLNIGSIQEFNITNMAASANMMVAESENSTETEEPLVLTEVVMETAPASVIIPPRMEVYEGMTLEELAAKIDRNLGTDIIAGKGMLIATECTNKGVDPYVATAILLHETGCRAKCSNLARYCNNFGGQKGSPSCNGGSYKRYDTMDEGIVGFIDNLYRNYYAVGLNTVESIGPKYAEGDTWIANINWYVNKIREN